MRSPAPIAPLPGVMASTNQQQEETHVDQSSVSLQLALYKAESDEDVQDQRSPARPAASSSTFASSPPKRPAAESSTKRTWRTGVRQQLLERTRNRIRRSSLHEQQLDSGGGSNRASVGVLDTNTVAPAAGDFAEEIESEAAEIRTLIARTAQLWSAVDRAERTQDLPAAPQLQPLRSFSASALHTSLPAQYECVEEEDNTLSSDEEEYEGGDEDEEDTETESTETTRQNMPQIGDYSTDNDAFVESLRHHGSSTTPLSNRILEQRRLEEEENDVNSDSGRESDGSVMEPERGSLQLEQGEILDASNRTINASKARAIKNAMLGNLLQLGFRETITRAALEAGVLEIDHYDSDCELAYVDIFMSLVKMVCDAHVDMMNEIEDLDQDWTASGSTSGDEQSSAYNLEQRSFLPFKWPVFDMAQFEFGNARTGTCFNSVCVLTNLPKVSLDRTEELMEVLSCHLFCMIGDPIQVVIPSASTTGRTKGHAFLEFDDPEMAKRCALAIDGLTWGRGPFGRIRGNLFRQYQVKSPAEGQRRAGDYVSDDGASLSRSFPSVPMHGSFPNDSSHAPAFERNGDIIAERFRPRPDRSDVAHQQNLFCASDEESSEADEWVDSHRVEYAQLNSSRLLGLSSGSVDNREQYEHVQRDRIALQLGWDDEALDGEYSMQMSGEGGYEDDDSFNNNSALELQAQDEDKLMDQSVFDDLIRGGRYNRSRCSSARVSLASSEAEAASSTVTSTASAAAREALADCGMVEQPWDVHEGNGAEKPWRRYCKDLIVRNREMHEQMALARRRIVQLSHNNQKLHLLIDRVERDRDGLLFETDLLQTQLHGYEDHEQHHDSLMKELVTLRKRLMQKEHSLDIQTLGPHQHVPDAFSYAPSGSFHSVQSALSYLSSTTLTSCKMDELKEWEHLLETALSHVRSVKEEKALEMQKKLDRQVEEQNELKLCVICLSNDKTILCLPCRHLCLCKTCSHREEVTKCPICRLEIEEMLAVYS